MPHWVGFNYETKQGLCAYVNKEDPDWPAHSPSLIRVVLHLSRGGNGQKGRL